MTLIVELMRSLGSTEMSAGNVPGGKMYSVM
jgi:hypothetical protein